MTTTNKVASKLSMIPEKLEYKDKLKAKYLDTKKQTLEPSQFIENEEKPELTVK